ncbi:DUF262 domain-containing protein [Nonomuraea sp. NPDC046570]|uniref:DUF262 domain-containing protein n=1 Tax=Nonomuraea sp. NPDC046570 TaxID=3155255 RepID=UPI0033CC3F5E
MNAPLNASATTIGALISSAVFEVPIYQRDYAWEKLQVEEFWNDLSNALGQGPYFLGLIVLTGDGKRKHVVDGQQRLVTLTLLAAALREEAVAIGRRALADKIESTLLRSMDYKTDEIVPRIVLTDPRTNDTLQSLIDDGNIPARDLAEGSSSERLNRSFIYLRDKLSEDHNSDGFRKLGTWAEFINEQLYVAVFEHPDEAAAYSVFEVVNTRGRQLTTADLLKNYILRHTPPGQRDAQYDAWHSTAEKFEQLGGQNYVQYIRHTVNLRAGYVLPKDLYNYIARRGDFSSAGEIPAAQLMEDLQHWLPVYLQMIDPTLGGPANADALGIFESLNELRVTAVRPLLLAISERESGAQSMERVLRLIVKRIVVGNLGASSIERKFAEAAREITRSGSVESGLTLLQDLDHSREEFVEALGRRSYNRDVLAFIRRSTILKTVTPDPVGTLHYIRPRQSASTWPDFGDDYLGMWGSTLGNTILAKIAKRPRGVNNWNGVQQSLISKAIPEERAAIIMAYETWTPKSVQREGLALAEEAADVWC